MEQVGIIGIDPAKNGFQLHGAYADGSGAPDRACRCGEERGAAGGHDAVRGSRRPGA